MVLYCETITPRITYVSEFLSKEMQLGTISITTSVQDFLAAEGPKINYSNELITDGIWIRPYGEGRGFLCEDHIHQVEVDYFEIDGMPAFFATAGDIRFDILAATFFLITRYEEYLPHQKDVYGRYAHENSTAYKFGFLKLPLVNIWAMNFREMLSQRWKLPTLSNQRFSFLPTYDIDIAWSYRNKGWLRTIGGITRSILKGNPGEAINRIKVLSGKKDDPFDSFEWLHKIHARYNLKPYYFFLVAKDTGRFDRNISPYKSDMRELIRHHSLHYPTGIHPSWQSGDEYSLLTSEIKTLSEITGHQVLCSRQHFIRFTLPETFRRLLDNGLLFDFSMGYGTINGFRASVSSPYYWYDLEKEEQTDLMLFPFCFMEANSFYEQKNSIEEALDEMLKLYDEVKKVNGTFSTIWHNSFLGTDPLYKGWRSVYERFMERAIGN